MKSSRLGILSLPALVVLTMHEAGAQAFVEVQKMVAVEVESAKPVSPWILEKSLSGYSGTGYFRSTAQYLEKKGVGTVEYRVKLATAGKWITILRTQSNATSTDAENDVWLQVNSGEWEKIWNGKAKNVWEWTSLVTDDRDGQTYNGYPNQLNAGYHTIRLSCRSSNFKVDRIALYHSTASRSTAQAMPQSPLEGPTGAVSPTTSTATSVVPYVAPSEGYSLTGAVLRNPFRTNMAHVRVLQVGPRSRQAILTVPVK